MQWRWRVTSKYVCNDEWRILIMISSRYAMAPLNDDSEAPYNI